MAISDVIIKAEDYNGLATPVENPGEYDGLTAPLENFEKCNVLPTSFENPGEFDSLILAIDNCEVYGLTSSIDYTEEYNALMTLDENSGMATPEENDGMATPEENNGMATTDENNGMGTPENNAQITLEENSGMAAPEEKNGMDTPEENNGMDTPEENNGMGSPEENNEQTSEEHPRKRRKKSMVWEHFTVETVSDGCRRAFCKQCRQSFAYSTGSKVSGTSHLKRHIANGTCLAVLRSQGNQVGLRMRGSVSASASEPPRRRSKPSNITPHIPFDSDRCRDEISRMIIMHDYPLHMVEHSGFLTFVQNLQPQFGTLSFDSVQRYCVTTYSREKQNMVKIIEGIPGRVCLSMDMWTSSESVGYALLTGHFIDNDWMPHRKILNVVLEPSPDSEAALSHAVTSCLSDWNLEGKLLSVTCNRPFGEPGLEKLRSFLCVKNPMILSGQLLIGHCIIRTMSSIAKEVLYAGQEIINKIRDTVKYVKTSESYEEKFIELRQQLQVPTEKSLTLDNKTQWNTTYQMLVAASESKEVFSCLGSFDPNYKEAPSMEHWKQIGNLCTYLKPLFDVCTIVTSTANPTAATLFEEVCKMLTEFGNAVPCDDDPFVSSITKPIHEMIGKYWKDCGMVLATAVVMDPRFKMKLVEFRLKHIYGDDAAPYIKIVDDGIHELYLEYDALPLPVTPMHAEERNDENMRAEELQGSILSDNGYTEFDVYVMETYSHQMKSELDQYLEEPLLPHHGEFDLLCWWKLNKLKYPTLSKMARDILPIPVSTAAADSTFDTSMKQLDRYWSSLQPATLEALVCAKDWLQ